MKKIWTAIVVLLCFTILFVSCSKPSGTPGTSDNGGPNSSQQHDDGQDNDNNEGYTEGDNTESGSNRDEDDGTEPIVSADDMKTISDFSDLWGSIYGQNEAIINAYDEMIIMELVTPPLGFLSGVQYDLLNLENKNGRFEGELMLAGWQAFVDKQGSEYTFGYDDVRDEDSFNPNDKAGDRLVENGVCNLKDIYYFSDSYTERDGVKLSRQIYEFKGQSDGSIAFLGASGQLSDFRGEENPNTRLYYVRNGQGRYDFVVGEAAYGTELDFHHIKDYDDLTKEQAIDIIEGAGYTIVYSGGISGGELKLD